MPNAGNPREPTQGGYTAHALRQNLWARQSINVRYVAELKKTMRI